QVAYRSALARSTARTSANSRDNDARQARDTARPTALQETLRDHRAGVRADEAQPRHQTLRTSRPDRGQQRMEVDRLHTQPSQAPATRETRTRITRAQKHATDPPPRLKPLCDSLRAGIMRACRGPAMSEVP